MVSTNVSSPTTPRTRVTIVGGGLSGISQAIQLRRQLGSLIDLTIIEKEHAAGGTWLNSTWPGAGVDIPIHLYSLYSDPKSDWSHVFADQEQVLGYLNECIEKHDLLDSFIFDTEYVSSAWDAISQTHTLTLRPTRSPGDPSRTYTHTTDILISANGPLSTPLIPKIPGLDKFKGIAFHNLHWRRTQNRLGFTFENKRIAVIGNGSSAIQLIPGLASTPGVELVQYIRSGGYYFPKNNTPIPAYKRFLYRYVPGVRYLHRYELFTAHNDRWKTRNDGDADGHDETEKVLLDYLRRTAPEEYLESLMPRYPLGCKRPAYDAGWLTSLHLPNVTLNSVGIASITETSIIDTTGKEFPADVIVFATGSDVARHGVGLNVGLYGEDGVELREFWKEIGGPQSYRGLAVPGFPNYFMTLGPNAIAGSWGYTIGNQTTVIARLIREMLDLGIGSLQPDRSYFEAHNAEIQEKLDGSTMNSKACSNWWRIGGRGRLSVPNPLDAIGLWKATRTTDWTHWIALAKPSLNADGDEEKPIAKRIDVDRELKRRRTRQTVQGTVLLAAIGGSALYWSNLGWPLYLKPAW